MTAVEMSGIGKRYGEVVALSDVSLKVAKATLHAIVGENGAGKTTLMRILYGAIQPDVGGIRIDGTETSFANTASAIAAGVGMVTQHYGIIPAMTCLQNLILGAEPGRLINLKAVEEQAQGLASSMGFHFEWSKEASSLTPASAQKLEILKLLWRQARIMILDEPTSMLSPDDSAALFASLNELVARGATVILITHRLPEVMSFCSTVTVLRAGRVVAERNVADVSPSELAELIVGKADQASESILLHPGDHAQEVPDRVSGFESSAPPALSLANVTVRDMHDRIVLDQVNFTIDPGEVVGVAGVDGNGQRELVQAVLGLRAASSGVIAMNGAPITGALTATRLRNGLRLIPEDRHAEGVIEAWSLERNAALGLHQIPPLRRGPWSELEARKTLAGRVAQRFDTRHGGLNLPMASLSGGNQQRFVAGRALELNPKVLIAFQPARGLDIAGTSSLYAAIREHCRAGMAALVISFDLDELLERCDRLVVMYGGKLFVPMPGRDDRTAIGRLMVGAE